MAHPKATDLPALLARLSDAGVEFIIVGGAACVIQGAPITTQDLDIVHQRTPENIERLLALLLQLDATSSTAELLGGRGHLNLSTSLGPLDPLCELDGQGFDELLPHSQVMNDEGRTLRVLDLPTLIALKTKDGRPKDRLVLPILIATLEERAKAKR